MEYNLGYSSLGGLIEFLKANPGRTLRVGFSNPHSYRGYYDQLAFSPTDWQSTDEALKIVEPCLGQTFQGYKGGDFVMRDYTEVWFATYGDSGGQMIGPMLLQLLLED